MNRIRITGFFLVVILAIIPLVGLLPQGLAVTHDGIDHVARIANFYRGLSEGILFPRWGGNLNWGYGHPILMFLYPLSSYMASILHFMGFSYVDSLKIIFGFGYIASGVTMYLWARKQFNEYFAVASSLLYMYAPYRFVDLYVRGAIGEHIAFIFPPLILYFIFKYFERRGMRPKTISFIGLSISFALLLLAHNAISLMFVPIIACYSLVLAYTRKEYKSLIYITLAVLNGFMMSSFFTVPAFLEGKFTLRDIVTGDEYRNRFVTNPLTFLYGAWSYGITGQFSVQIGIAHILGLLVVPLFFLKTKKKEVKLVLFMIIIFFAGSLFLMIPQSNFLYQLVTTLQKFQFPWRFLTLTVFTSSVVGASIFIILKNKKAKNIAMCVLILLLFFSTFSYWWAKSYKKIPDNFFETVYNGTTDTGESSPIWSVRFMEKKPMAHAEVISGKAVIVEKTRKSTEHKYSITVLTDSSRIRENTLYFPSWKVYIDGKDTAIQFQDPSERGLITYNLDKGSHSVIVEFKDTKLRMFSNMLSILSVFLTALLGLIIFKYKHEK